MTWSLAAVASNIEQVPHSLKDALDYHRRHQSRSEVELTAASEATRATTRLVETGAFGVGPFSITLSGNERSAYISIQGDSNSTHAVKGLPEDA